MNGQRVKLCREKKRDRKKRCSSDLPKNNPGIKGMVTFNSTLVEVTVQEGKVEDASERVQACLFIREANDL